MTTFTPIERAAYATMQARLIVLLLRHDEDGFRRFIDARPGFTPDAEDAVPRRYRELGVLFFLRDELFEHILPRIVRRLSFELPRSTIIEEPPARGRIDWARTLDAAWAERPGEPPLVLHTRQRRRDFATAENMLTVATLLEYRADVQRALWSERGLIGNEALRHPLNEIVEQCDRELAFPQFAGLRRAAQQIIESDDTETLEAQVYERLIPGGNSAYEDLLTWRARRRNLRLLRRDQIAVAEDVLGADPDEDNYLYQLWLFYELADLLRAEGCLDYLDTRPASTELRFHWGIGTEQRSYQLLHDQGIDRHWDNAPGLRPDYYVRRIDRIEVRTAGAKAPIWHEAGYVLDAKYYKPRSGSRAPGNSVKRMIADLHLAGERRGALLFAFQRDPSPKSTQAIDQELEPDTEAMAQQVLPLYQVTPERTTAFAVQPDTRIAIWRVLPENTDDAYVVRSMLTAVLDSVHQALKERVAIECFGFLPDVDTINPGNNHPQLCQTCGELLAFCPKPHVSSDRIDRVCPRCDCLQNMQLCHIIDRVSSQIPLPPFVRRVLTQNDLLNSISAIKAWLRAQTSESDESEHADQARKQVLTTLGELTESYIKLTRADTTQIERNFSEWVFGEYWQDSTHPRGLPETVRHMLVSGEYVWNEFQRIGIEDWAACAVQYIRALEYEMHRRLYDPCGTQLLKSDGTPMETHQFTFGSPAPMYYNRKKSPNWQTLITCVAQPSGVDEHALKTLIMDIEAIRLDRNKVAHTERVDAVLAAKIRDAVLGQRYQPGLLLRLSSLRIGRSTS